MYSWQVDKLTLHPGLFSYELVSQNLETWAVGTLDESGIMAQWDRWKQLILEPLRPAVYLASNAEAPEVRFILEDDS